MMTAAYAAQGMEMRVPRSKGGSPPSQTPIPAHLVYPRKVREYAHHLFDSTVWNAFDFRDDDIVIGAYAKCGTTWVQQIVAQLLFDGAEDIDIARISPWLDCRFPDKAEKLDLLAAQEQRRFVKTHLPVDALVFSRRAKYIYLGRDGRDVVWSLHNHHANFKPGVVRKIDSVPHRTGPPLGETPPAILPYFRRWLHGNGCPWWPYWQHVRSWWQIRHLPNVMLLHFAELKANLPAQIRRIAAFLNIPIDASKWSRILEHCTFNYMRAHSIRSIPFAGGLWKGGLRTFLHKGTNGRWRPILPAADVARYEATARTHLGPEAAHWLATGQGAQAESYAAARLRS